MDLQGDFVGPQRKCRKETRGSANPGYRNNAPAADPRFEILPRILERLARFISEFPWAPFRLALSEGALVRISWRRTPKDKLMTRLLGDHHLC